MAVYPFRGCGRGKVQFPLQPAHGTSPEKTGLRLCLHDPPVIAALVSLHERLGPFHSHLWIERRSRGKVRMADAGIPDVGRIHLSEGPRPETLGHIDRKSVRGVLNDLRSEDVFPKAVGRPEVTDKGLKAAICSLPSPGVFRKELRRDLWENLEEMFVSGLRRQHSENADQGSEAESEDLLEGHVGFILKLMF